MYYWKLQKDILSWNEDIKLSFNDASSYMFMQQVIMQTGMICAL